MHLFQHWTLPPQQLHPSWAWPIVVWQPCAPQKHVTTVMLTEKSYYKSTHWQILNYKNYSRFHNFQPSPLLSLSESKFRPQVHGKSQVFASANWLQQDTSSLAKSTISSPPKSSGWWSTSQHQGGTSGSSSPLLLNQNMTGSHLYINDQFSNLNDSWLQFVHTCWFYGCLSL